MHDDRQGFEEELATGHALAWQGNWENAAAAYRRAVTIAPNEVAGRIGLAMALSHLGDPSSAFEQIQVVLPKHQRSRLLLSKSGETLLQSGRQPEATKAFLALGDLLAGEGKEPRAIQAWQRAAELSPEDEAPRTRLLAAYQRSGEADLAATERRTIDRPHTPVPSQLTPAPAAVERSAGRFLVDAEQAATSPPREEESWIDPAPVGVQDVEVAAPIHREDARTVTSEEEDRLGPDGQESASQSAQREAEGDVRAIAAAASATDSLGEPIDGISRSQVWEEVVGQTAVPVSAEADLAISSASCEPDGWVAGFDAGDGPEEATAGEPAELAVQPQTKTELRELAQNEPWDEEPTDLLEVLEAPLSAAVADDLSDSAIEPVLATDIGCIDGESDPAAESASEEPVEVARLGGPMGVVEADAAPAVGADGAEEGAVVEAPTPTTVGTPPSLDAGAAVATPTAEPTSAHPRPADPSSRARPKARSWWAGVLRTIGIGGGSEESAPPPRPVAEAIGSKPECTDLEEVVAPLASVDADAEGEPTNAGEEMPPEAVPVTPLIAAEPASDNAEPDRPDGALSSKWASLWDAANEQLAEGQVLSALDNQIAAVHDLLSSLRDREGSRTILMRLPGVDEFAALELMAVAPERRAELLVALARIEAYLAQDLRIAAWEECARAIEQAPGFLPVQIAMARVLELMGREGEAEVKYKVLAEVCELRGQLEMAARLREKLHAVA